MNLTVDMIDNRRIKLRWGDDDINSNVDSARICVWVVWICLGVELVRSTQGWKFSFWGSEDLAFEDQIQCEY